jgi:hypothetical protein
MSDSSVMNEQLVLDTSDKEKFRPNIPILYRYHERFLTQDGRQFA